MLTSSFWRERRVFLTGHTGFKGAWLALMLERLNARVTGYAFDPSVAPSFYELADAGRSLCDVRGDVGDVDFLDGVLRAADPDIVIHLATRPPRGAAHREDERQAQGEIDRAIIEAADAAPSVQAAVLVLPEPRKSASSRRTAARQVGACVRTLLCPDPVGGGDFASSCPPDAAALHVLDAAYGILLLAEKSCGGAARAEEWDFDAAASLGWSALLSAADAADATRRWRDAYAAGADMAAWSRDDVDRYLGQRVRLISPFGSLDGDAFHDRAAVA